MLFETYATTPGLDRDSLGRCTLKVRTYNPGGSTSMLSLEFDSYYAATIAFLAVGGIFPDDALDEQLGWSGDTVMVGTPSGGTITLKAIH